jgi:uncharacterized tellurite resistance protein B-like protein|tara:strand:- start:11514 stop:11957 length:444 start_codon:yes stop_codon:yes gene_type:complete
MLNKIKSLFKKEKISVLPVKEDYDINLTCASLIIEVALADKDFDITEINLLKIILKDSYNISPEKIDNLIESAESTVKNNTSLYSYTREINDSLNYEQKIALLDGLWKISYADGTLDKFEEHLVRKISDLIHISHGDFITSKLKNRD